MSRLNPSMRLKVKRDTVFLPDPNGGVYFRNNLGSFRMEGGMIDQWIEKLMPMFNGEHSLEELTDGLPAPYRDRVFEIAEVLFQNGVVRDVSEDHPHQLPDEVLKTFASQIEFLDHFGGSGAFRFQRFRQAKLLAVGSGPFLVSLVASLFETGLSRIHILVTDEVPTNRQRLAELTAQARKADPRATLEEIHLQEEEERGWRETVRPFDAILYVSQEGDVEELRVVHGVCREEKKVFIPAWCAGQAGMAGPLVLPESEGCWESAWRRLHRNAICKDPEVYSFSSTAGALLANVIVFEAFKTLAGLDQPKPANKVFLLDLETLEGNWHPFLPHPLVAGHRTAERVDDLDLRLEGNPGKSDPGGLFAFFSKLTSPVTGVFHVWEEGDLPQLPLAQCRVQAADPLSDGPAGLIPEIVCNGLTHEEARREAGLVGIEAYVSRMAVRLVVPSQPAVEGTMAQLQPFAGVGAGETVAEGICRGLLNGLNEELRKRHADQPVSVSRVQLRAVEDERCRFYLRALTIMQGAPTIGLGAEVYGFPVAWVGAGGLWFGSAGLNLTMALRKAFQQALLKVQNRESLQGHGLVVSSVVLDEKPVQSLDIPAYEDDILTHAETLRSAILVLERHHRRLQVFDLAVEPFLREKLGGVFGIILREEESR